MCPRTVQVYDSHHLVGSQMVTMEPEHKACLYLLRPLLRSKANFYALLGKAYD